MSLKSATSSSWKESQFSNNLQKADIWQYTYDGYKKDYDNALNLPTYGFNFDLVFVLLKVAGYMGM